MKDLLPFLGFLFIGFTTATTSRAEENRPIAYFILEGGGPDEGPGPDREANLEDLKRTLGPVNPNAVHMYGYGIEEIRILTRSSSVIRREVNEALDAAERTGIPVWLRIDPLFGWGADLEGDPKEAPAVKFWLDPAMREWMEFPKDERLPTYIPRLWFNWGNWCSPVSAFPAIGSPKFIAFARKQFKEGVLDPLEARRRAWKKSGKDYLFAGINVGSECLIPQYDREWLSALGWAGGPEMVQSSFPKGLVMDKALVGAQLGYASLYWQGWNEQRLDAAAAREGISRDEKFQHLCYGVIHDFMEALSQQCAEAGLPPDRVYTHITALSTVQEPSTKNPPIWTAVNPYATPGFTMDNHGGARYDLDKVKQLISSAPGSRGNKFGVAETYFVLGDKIYVTDASEYKGEIDRMFDNGAQVMVILAAFPFSSGRCPGPAIQAVRAWLAE